MSQQKAQQNSTFSRRPLLNGAGSLVLGRIGMDLYPEEQEKIKHAQLLRPALGGSSGNIAAGIARLSGQVEMLGLVSDDPVGAFVRQQCVQYGIGTRYLGTAPFGTNTNLALAENRLEDFEVVIYRNKAADLALDISHLADVDFSTFGRLIVTGTALSAEPSHSAAIYALKASTCAILDLDYRAAAWVNNDPKAVLMRACECSDIIIGNDEEFALLGGVETAQQLGESKIVVYKKGAKGAQTFAYGHRFETPIFAVEALKPVGAGDAFMAGFVMALEGGNSLERAVLEGAANAAIVVSRPACAPAMPRQDELRAFLAARGA